MKVGKRDNKSSNAKVKASTKSQEWIDDMREEIEDMLTTCQVISLDLENPDADHEGAIATIEDFIRDITGLFEEFAKLKPNCKDWDPLAEKVFQCIDDVAEKTEQIYLESDREEMNNLATKLGCKRYPSKF